MNPPKVTDAGDIQYLIATLKACSSTEGVRSESDVTVYAQDFRPKEVVFDSGYSSLENLKPT